jgi:hypothetical protein
VGYPWTLAKKKQDTRHVVLYSGYSSHHALGEKRKANKVKEEESEKKRRRRRRRRRSNQLVLPW